ncbi:hypothetical protein GRJ2_000857500 [Grus japonensis]|uniref:Uncharacterized protein n=1 Tax=Grus japonensis TaxID=30415 RepID=A0ABC9WHY0_GRUJA
MRRHSMVPRISLLAAYLTQETTGELLLGHQGQDALRKSQLLGVSPFHQTIMVALQGWARNFKVFAFRGQLVNAHPPEVEFIATVMDANSAINSLSKEAQVSRKLLFLMQYQ